MENKFEFTNFSMTSQNFDTTKASAAVVTPSCDNGRNIWATTDEE